VTATLAAKLIVTPLLIAAATLTGRRWGHSVGGWLVGLPLTSGPVALFVALEHGPRFATATAIATVFGVASQAAFAVAYSRTLGRGVPLALLSGTAAFAVFTAAFDVLPQSLPLGLAASLGGLALGLWILRPGAPAISEREPPAWDLPLRMLLATALVVALTAASGAIGARLTGLLTPYPVYASVLALFAGAAGAQVMRGLLSGLFGFVAFFAVLALLLVPGGLVIAFAAAVAVNLAVQAAALAVLRRTG
jgi:hypothetical protein